MMLSRNAVACIRSASRGRGGAGRLVWPSLTTTTGFSTFSVAPGVFETKDKLPSVSNLIETRRPFSAPAAAAAAMASQKDKIVDARKQLWEFYLSTGRGANALFEAIDLDEDGSVSPQVLQDFMKDALSPHPPEEIMPYAWNRLEQRAAAGQMYDLKAFKSWLIAATKMSADTRNKRMLEYFRKHPLYHELYNEEEDEESAVYTWNEDTMNQSLRRMQYAVRGEVVMRADQLAAEGREILYTNIGTMIAFDEAYGDALDVDDVFSVVLGGLVWHTVCDLSLTTTCVVLTLLPTDAAITPIQCYRKPPPGWTGTNYVLSPSLGTVRLAPRGWCRSS